MKSMIKAAAYTVVAMTSVTSINSVSALVTGKERVSGDLKGASDNGGNIFDTIQSIIVYLLTFLALVAVIFAIYGGFQILTAGGDEEKVKKGKTTLINALLGIFVIWIAWALVNWLMSGLTSLEGGAG